MTTTSSSRLPRYKRAAVPPPMILTERDEAIINWVAELRFATQEQIQALLFSPSTASSCKRRLTLLFHNAYLDRRLIPLRSSFGANRAVYCLDKKGADLLALRRKTGDADPNWRPGDNNREVYFLEHTIGINDFRVVMTLAAKKYRLNLSWTDERQLRSRALKQVVADPKQPGKRLAVVPDGYFVLENDSFRQGFALELDRSTVEERPFKEKVRALGEWKVTGAYRKAFDIESLRVLFVVASTARDKKRIERIKAWTEAEGGQNLFWFASLQDVKVETVILEPVWQIASRSGAFALFTRPSSS